VKQRTVGRSGLRVSHLGLGTMTWGVETDADEAAAQLVAFHDAGGTLVDTAASYGYGEAESILGHLVADVVPRVDLVIASKAGITRTPESRTIDASRGALLRRLDESLRKLGTDYLDLWYVHYVDDTVPFDETLAALDHAVSSGRVRYAGVSNYCGWRIARAATWQRAVPGRAPILGARTLGQLTGALASEALDLPREIHDALDDVSAPSIGYPEDVH
jgi:aryl-alcohol dehydrogenase-like predicted oxidoreductase